jgi:hypothetical protein
LFRALDHRFLPWPFGLSAYTTQRRFKEIGVRKVLSVLLIALVTVSFRAAKAALANPIASLHMD